MPSITRHSAVTCLLCAIIACSVAQTASANSDVARQHPRSLQSTTTATAAGTHPNLTKYGHKHLIPLTPNDIGLCIAVAFALFIASGAGVGGGILVVPALLLIGGFGSVDGVGLSNITVLSLAVSTMCFQITRRHPARDAPLIDWDLVMLFGPPSVVGSISGSYINMIIPSWVTKVTLLLLLLPITWRMVNKARMLYTKENASKRAQNAPVKAADKQPEGTAIRDHNPLHRLSETIHNLTRQSAAIPDMYGAELAYLSSEGLDISHLQPHQAAAAADGPAAVVGLPISTQQQQQQQSKDHDLIAQKKIGIIASAAADSDLLSKDSSAAAAAAAAAEAAAAMVCNDLESQGSDLAAAAAAAAAVPGKMSWWRLNPAYVHAPGQKEALRAKIAREEAAQLPLLQVGLLVLILASVIVTNITGGYLVKCGTPSYWLLVLTPLPLMLIMWGVMRHHVLWKANCKRCLGMKHNGDLKWNRRNTILYPLICISAGLIAGLLGLGGGLILTPLMLELGVHPAVSVASSQITMLIGNSTSAIVYAVAGAIPWDYGATLVIIGFISALSGQIIVSWLVRKLGRSSLIVMVLSVMFTLATAAALTVVVTTMIDIRKHPEKLTAHKAVCIN